jgi:peptidoglycan/xylan/chitin deacetylase (PgdA/CDA1 family)
MHFDEGKSYLATHSAFPAVWIAYHKHHRIHNKGYGLKRIALCYHQVAPASQVGRSLSVEPERLESHVRFFQRRGLKLVLGRDIVLTNESCVCFTFDDAYESTLTYGLEVLHRREAPATFFAVPSLVGATSSWDAGRERPLADWNLLKSAYEMGFEIGNHTMTHARLTDLSQERQELEWHDAHAALKSSGIDATCACYPYGFVSPESPGILSKLGYRTAFSIGRWPGDNDPFRLARIVVAYSDGLPMLLYKLSLRPYLPGRRANRAKEKVSS